MLAERESLLRDVGLELGLANRPYVATVTSVEFIDHRVSRVGFRTNRRLDRVKDRLEGGELSLPAQGDEAGNRWKILSVGDDAGECDVLFLHGEPFPAHGRNQTVFLRLFDFVRPVVVSLSKESPRRWISRTQEVLEWLDGVEPPPRLEPGERSVPFRADLDASWNAALGCVWGPPGTGKTWTLGQQVAKAALEGKRILVTSTTNDATDIAAAEIMSAMKRMAGGRPLPTVKRVGRGLRHSKFEDPTDGKFHHPEVLPEDPPEMKAEIEELERAQVRAGTSREKARLRAALHELKSMLADHATRCILDESCRVVVTTNFSAVARIVGSTVLQVPVLERVELGPLFDAVCMDEAGLVSGPLVGALAPYTDTRVVLFGDSRQLAPIAQLSKSMKISSIAKMADEDFPTTTYLRHQRRMDTPIREVVSRYTYDNTLADGDLHHRDPVVLPQGLGLAQGALVVLFLEDVLLASGRPIPEAGLQSSLGENRQSRMRTGTAAVLRSILSAYPDIAEIRTAFVSPFRAQVRFVRESLAGAHGQRVLQKGHAWSFSTVHAQQGGEAPFVFFDTVDLTKGKGWLEVDAATRLTDWQRLLNVAISRGERSVVIATTRAEWNHSRQQHVCELRGAVDASDGCGYVTWDGGKQALVPVDAGVPDPAIREPRPRTPGTLGAHMESIALARPVLTEEQRELTRLVQLDGPWMVRGAPGSGKTLAMVEWAVRTAAEHTTARVGIVHFTGDLGKVIKIELVAAGRRVPNGIIASGRVEVMQFHEFLGIRRGDDWQGEHTCEHLLERRVRPAFDALFVDEAQDFGEHGICYLTASTKGRNIRVLLDPMQATGDAVIQRWEDLGFPRARTRFLIESHRSTRQIADFAMNLFALLGGDTGTMREDGLVHPVFRIVIGGAPVEILATDFVLHEGPAIDVRAFPNDRQRGTRGQELDWVAGEVLRLMDEESLLPTDIGIVVNPHYLLPRDRAGAGFVNFVHRQLQTRLPELALQRGMGRGVGDAIQVHGLNNVKGLEFEVVFMVGADTLAPYPGNDRVLRAPDLYTAATRARQKLVVTGTSFPTAVDDHSGLDVLEAVEMLARTLSSDEFDEARDAWLEQ